MKNNQYNFPKLVDNNNNNEIIIKKSQPTICTVFSKVISVVLFPQLAGPVRGSGGINNENKPTCTFPAQRPRQRDVALAWRETSCFCFDGFSLTGFYCTRTKPVFTPFLSFQLQSRRLVACEYGIDIFRHILWCTCSF